MSDESSELLDLIVNSDSEIELDSGRSLADQSEWCPSDPERPLTPLPPPILESAKVSKVIYEFIINSNFRKKH